MENCKFMSQNALYAKYQDYKCVQVFRLGKYEIVVVIKNSQRINSCHSFASKVTTLVQITKKLH